MEGINVIINGTITPANIERMFVTHGPYQLNGLRLDKLSKVEVLVDSSTTTKFETGSSVTKSKTGSMIGRTIVGGVVLGGAGAIIGGATGKKASTNTSITTETRDTELTVQLTFYDGITMNVFITKLESFHWLLGMAGHTPMSDKQIESERVLAIATKNIADKNKALTDEEIRRWEFIDKLLREKKIKKPINIDFTNPETKGKTAMILTTIGTLTVFFLEFTDNLVAFMLVFLFIFVLIFLLTIPLVYLIATIFKSYHRRKMKTYNEEGQKVYEELFSKQENER